ncbi:MAG: aminotransferase class V-fold PLP-dependent enzyme [Paracoccaceae bacterium]
MPLNSFRKTLDVVNPIKFLRDGLIGEGRMIPGKFGEVPLVYADYVASGRALQQVENFIATHVLPFYANTHTDASYCGDYTTNLRAQARAEIARLTHADENCTVVFSGAGATAGLNRLIALLGVEQAENPVVLIGPYEHHSNILPWRESKATVVEIPEAPMGGPDMGALEQTLLEHQDADLLIGSFSAASNVTGIITDATAVTRLLKSHKAISIWDYAGGAPYLSIDMASGTDAEKDAVVISAHKFPGGPAASGVLILRNNAVKRDTPTWPGGGTVTFVSPWRHDYHDSISEREEAGTPNVIGDIRAALVFMIKDSIGQDAITAREHELNEMAMAGWADNPHLTLFDVENQNSLPIFSFLVKDAQGEIINAKHFTHMLSDTYGIQARGGCACAGPYGHRLLGVDRATSDSLRSQILAGNDDVKPGWVRLNFSYLMDDRTACYIIDSVNRLALEMGARVAV